MTWNEVIKLEPRLQNLYDDVLPLLQKHYEEYGYFNGAEWYELLKPKVEKLVGFYSDTSRTELQTADAYEAACFPIVQRMYECYEIIEDGKED